jgi:hypothetical protein
MNLAALEALLFIEFTKISGVSNKMNIEQPWTFEL